MVVPEERARAETALRETIDSGCVRNLEHHWRRSDGPTVPIELNATAMRDSDGNPTALLLVCRDVTERKRAQSEHERLEGQLRQAQKMEAVGQLAGGVAHDFNNLLQVIQGSVLLAMGDLGAAHPCNGHLEEARKATERAATLVRQLLTFSHKVPLRADYLDLNVVIADLAKMLRRVIGEHIQLEIRSHTRLPSVFADRGQIEQVLINLCVNARDAMPAGGTLTIETGTSIPASDHSGCPCDLLGERFLFLKITDTGCGIAPEIRERIFEPFFTTKDVGKGTGLGHSTVYSIVQRHAGSIRLDSQPGHGSAFTICLPAAEAPATVLGNDEAPRAALVGDGETILLAEDEELVRRLSIRVLERAGYHVLVAREGEEAERMFRQHSQQIDLAVLDVVMPKKTGGLVDRALKEQCPDLPILLTSGYSLDPLHRALLPPEDAPLLPKPFKPSELLARVSELLGASRRRKHG